MSHSTKATPAFNILLLGPTQSGKSTLLEGIRRYVDPTCSVDDQAIGNGHGPHTSEIRVLELQAGIKETDMRGLRNFNARDSRTLFRVIDTPGFDETSDCTEMHATAVLQKLGTLGQVHLVLFTISRHTPTTQGLLKALMAYSNLFSALRRNMALLHTHQQVTNDAKQRDAQSRRGHIFEDVMVKHTPQFSIDCDLDETRPDLVRMREATIKKILLQAIENAPTALQSSALLQKTSRMRAIDNMVRTSCLSKINVLDHSLSRTAEIELSFKIQEAEEYLNHYDTQDLELVFEMRCARDSMICDIFTVRDDVVLLVRGLDCAIDGLVRECTGVIKGSVHRGRWHMRPFRGNKQGRIYYAKLYAKRCETYRAEIDEKKAKVVAWRRALDDALWYRHFKEEISLLETSLPRLERSSSSERRQYLDMVDRLSRRTIPLDLFVAMAEAGVYEGSHMECMWKAEAFYENKHVLATTNF
ncbi:hypothetical protein BGZ72_003344 [Mortierella alpina]|nr:hypothetical protein BGZ72_003344 [Mortierella alpina]